MQTFFKIQVTIVSNRDVKVSNFEVSSPLDLKVEDLNIPGKMKVKKLKMKAKDIDLTGYVGSEGEVEVNCDNFTNTSGSMESLRNISFYVGNEFKNTGGKKTQIESRQVSYCKEITIPSHKFRRSRGQSSATWPGDYPGEFNGRLAMKGYKREHTNVDVAVDIVDLDKMAQIACKGRLEISAQQVFNKFGVLCSNGLTVRSTLDNSRGFIKSSGDFLLNGREFYNGNIVRVLRYIQGVVNPNLPIILNKQLPGDVSWNKHRHTFHSNTYTISSWGLKSTPVIQGYAPYEDGMVPLLEDKYPGYIFAEGNVRIESKLPKSDDSEVRARLIQAYLNEHGAEIIADSERYTLGEIKAEVELTGSVKNEKAKSFLARYAEAEMISAEFERNSEEGIRQVYSGIAEGFNRLLIPGYCHIRCKSTP